MDRYASIKLFLVESLTNYKNPHKVSFAILHAITALELVLKERLYKINPYLIYEKIDGESNKAPRNTVRFSSLAQRLKKSWYIN